MMAEQLTFDLPRRTALGREDFFVSAANETALASLDNWRNWPVPRLALAGPQGSGKSHLARVWAAESGALVVDFFRLAELEAQGPDRDRPLVIEDADRVSALDAPERAEAERALFHLHNLLGEHHTPLLLTGVGAPAHWAVDLPDLASRLAAIPVARIVPPDPALLEAILVKLFTDRQLAVTPDLIAYLLVRIERSAAAAERVVAALDRAAMRERRAITRPFAADELRRLGLIHEMS